MGLPCSQRYARLAQVTIRWVPNGTTSIEDSALAPSLNAASTCSSVRSITGSADTWPYPGQISLEKRMHGMGRPLEAYVYPGADHAFAQPLYNGGDTYDPMATMVMRNVLDGFLERHLGSAM